MLFALQPDRSVTGGAFYEGDRFDSDLVEVIFSPTLNEQEKNSAFTRST